MLKILQEFYFPINCNRKNIIINNEQYRGFCLGLIKNWVGGHSIQDCKKLNVMKYKKLFEETMKYFNYNSPESDFNYTTIQYNKNHKCKKHIDKNNVGESYIIAFGDYEGGRLIVYDANDNPEYIDIKNKFYKFNGAKFYHETEDFKGERYSLVFYNILSNDNI